MIFALGCGAGVFELVPFLRFFVVDEEAIVGPNHETCVYFCESPRICRELIEFCALASIIRELLLEIKCCLKSTFDR